MSIKKGWNILSLPKKTKKQEYNDQIFFIINNNLDGDSYEWQKGLEKLIHLVTVYNYNIFLEILEQHNSPENIVVFINSFLNTDFTIEKIFFLYDKFKFKIILPIHDWFTFILNNMPNNQWHSFYLNDNIKIPEKSKKLFDICSKIICPSNFVYNFIYKYYPNKKIKKCEWLDSYNDKKYKLCKLPKMGAINIGVLYELNEFNGKEQIMFLFEKYKNNKNINIFVVGLNIDHYINDYTNFINIIKKYNIHGLLYLYKWGDTWGYPLTHGLISGLPIFYNNIGSFKERIPKNNSKYIINNNNETDFFKYDILNKNFIKFVQYIKTNEIFINNECGYNFNLPKNNNLIDILKENISNKNMQQLKSSNTELKNNNTGTDKLLVLFVFHVYNDRVINFINNCIFKDNNVDFILISNDKNCNFNYPEYVKVLKRDNIGFDFGGWSDGLLTNNLYKNYDKFIFVNSSVIGPFLYPSYKGKWTDIYINGLQDNVKLFGSTINTMKNDWRCSPKTHSHVQSYIFSMNKETLEYLIKHEIFSITNYAKTLEETVVRKEIGMSQKIIENKWNIGSLLTYYKDIDFTFSQKKLNNYKIRFLSDPMCQNFNNTFLWDIYELVFIKGNRLTLKCCNSCGSLSCK